MHFVITFLPSKAQQSAYVSVIHHTSTKAHSLTCPLCVFFSWWWCIVHKRVGCAKRISKPKRMTASEMTNHHIYMRPSKRGKNKENLCKHTRDECVLSSEHNSYRGTFKQYYDSSHLYMFRSHIGRMVWLRWADI